MMTAPSFLANCANRLLRSAGSASGALALAVLAVLPQSAQATSGEELITLFDTQCVDPFPSITEIAAAAQRIGFEEHELKAEDVIGSNSLSLEPQLDLASIVSFDARGFWSPSRARDNSLITGSIISAVSLERAEAGGGHLVENACSVSAIKANEGRPVLESGAVRIARILEARFGLPFKWERQVKRETGELSIGQVAWQPDGQRATGGDRPSILANLEYIESEPGEGKQESSFWILILKRREARQ
jgi:hypothetical protein